MTMAESILMFAGQHIKRCKFIEPIRLVAYLIESTKGGGSLPPIEQWMPLDTDEYVGPSEDDMKAVWEIAQQRHGRN